MQTATKDSSRPSAKESRRARRYRSKIEVSVDYKGRKIPGRLYDLSESGLALTLDQAFFGPPGTEIVIQAKEIGYINGIVRWTRDKRVGVSFNQSSASVAQVKAYFRFFHKDIVANA